MAWSTELESSPEATVSRATGCSRLCLALAGVGLAATTAASLFTYRTLHEPLESVGASVVNHLASAKCTAIARTLTALSIARSDVLNGEPEGERTEPDAEATIGVVTPGSWTLEDFHSSNLTEAQVLTVLRGLPLQAQTSAAAGAVRAQLNLAPPDLRADLREHRCEQLGYGLAPSAVRVYAIPGRSDGSLAFLYGPLMIRGQEKTAFALVDLNASTLNISGHDATLHELFPSGGGELRTAVKLSPPSVLRNQLTLHGAMPDLDEEDHKLVGLRVVPFANQLVSTEFSVSHEALDRISRRSAALVFLMGLLATAAVVLMSRSSEMQLRGLNLALRKESRTDGLTRIANRRAWDEALALEESRRQRHGHRYGLVVVDLDGFKQINDRQGHQAGDQVLQIAATQLASQLRTSDLLARVGGDEFALLVFSPTPKGLNDLVERLRTSLTQAGIQASIGAALSEERTTLDQTWAKADDAMYGVKTSALAPAPSPSETT